MPLHAFTNTRDYQSSRANGFLEAYFLLTPVTSGAAAIHGSALTSSPQSQTRLAGMARTIDLRLELSGVSPRVWRVLRVPVSLRLDDLHQAIQAVMGWGDFHPHVFEVGERDYGPRPDEDENDDDGELKEKSAWAGEDSELSVAKALEESPEGMTYLYDFAEDWRVRITLESESDTASAAQVACIGGEHGGPQQELGATEAFSIEWANQRLAKALRPLATPDQPAGPRATSDQQLLAHLTLAVLMLASRPTRHGTREAWKNVRPEILDSLQEAGLIQHDPQRKSVSLTDAGVAHAERLLGRLRAL
jgi:hypothetical protein